MLLFFLSLTLSLTLFFLHPHPPLLSLSNSEKKTTQEKAGTVTRWFKLKNTLIVPRSSPEFPGGGGGGGGLDEEESNGNGNSNALELVEMPSSQLSAAPDPEMASRDLRAALSRREAVEERRRGFSDRMKGAEVEKTFDLRVCVQVRFLSFDFFSFFFLSKESLR